ncbi:MAG TPA: 3'-5' exonuclease, partial [Candidatus Dormibacteraeota bacterium]|nr:3'-5' exonuclease [Candidatus Dormibacteraeota bacterium]
MEGAISLSGELPALPDIPIETDHRAGPGPSAESGAHRRLYGRQRATPVPGVAFIARLGPASSDHSARHNAVTVEATGSGAALVPDAETLIEDLRFVSVDCETTGQNPHHLVEVGAVVFTMAAALPGGDGVHPPPDAFETLVHTADHINPYARRVHGISRAMLHGAPSALPVLRRFLTFARGTVLVEHSADAFDTRLIGRTLG